MNGWAALAFFVLAAAGWAGCSIAALPAQVAGAVLLIIGWLLSAVSGCFIRAAAWCWGMEKEDQ